MKRVAMSMAETQKTQDDRNVFFLPGIFNETLALLTDAHEYFHLFGEEDNARYAAVQERSLYSCEMSRITLRLSAVLAWLMVRRAVFAGRIADSEARQKFHLDWDDACLRDNPGAREALPSYMCALLERSLDLYQRIHRLDTLRTFDFGTVTISGQ